MNFILQEGIFIGLLLAFLFPQIVLMEWIFLQYLTDEDATYWRLRISRGRKSFLVIRNKESFAFEDENGFHTPEELTSEVLTSLPKFEPFSFEDYYRECCGGEDAFPRKKVKEWHETEIWEYKQVLRLFPDILDELIEIIYG